MRAPSAVSSVMRRSSSTTPSERLTVQSSPDGSTLPRSLSPSNEPPVIGSVMREPCGPAPMFCVGAVLRRSDIRGRDRMTVLLSEDLLDRVDGAFGAPIAVRYGEEAIQERVLRVPGFEAGRGPEVV